MNVYDIIANAAQSWPNEAAIIDEHGALSYQALWEQVEQTRSKLIKLGIQPEEGVGVMGKSSRDFIISAFAALGCGAMVLPISPNSRKWELDSLIETMGLRVVLYDDRKRHPTNGDVTEIAMGNAGCMQFARTGINKKSFFRQLVPDAAFARFTSGTTSKSKGVILSHKTVFERIEAANKGLKLSCHDRVLWVLPMAFHFFVSIILYLRYGAAIVICPDHFAETMLELSNQHNTTLLYASPLHYRLLAANESGRRFKTLNRAISTAISLPTQTSEAFWDRYRIPITQAYGIIEVGLPLINLDKPLERPESVGRALPDYDVAVLDDNLCPVSDRSTGQLAIKGPGIFDAYLDPALRRDEVLQNGWFLTGDLAFRDKEGFFTILGRSKAMINVGGNKVFPEEVEAVINQHPKVAASKVSAKPHAQLGEVIHADVVCHEDSPDIDSEQIIAFCRSHLSSFKVPSSVSFAEAIEHTDSGKIYRH